jgi:hypothetical protein
MTIDGQGPSESELSHRVSLNLGKCNYPVMHMLWLFHHPFSEIVKVMFELFATELFTGAWIA